MKSSHPIFTFLLVISILVTSSVARSYPPKCLSHGPSGSKLILYGRPPRCFQAGLQGPCSVDEVLLPRSETSSLGVCRRVAVTTTKIPSDVQGKNCDTNVEYYDVGEENSDSQLTKAFRTNGCRNKLQTYSTILQRCIPNQSARLQQNVIG